MENRIQNVLNELHKQNLESMLITSSANFYYISNYYTDPHERVIAIYLSHKTNPIMILPAMEVEDAKNSGWTYEIIGYHDHENPWEQLANVLQKFGENPQTMALEKDHVTIERYVAIQEILPKAEIVDGKEILANLRVIKDETEYKRLKQAAELADFGVEIGAKAIRESISEYEVIAKIEYELKKQGVQGMSFSTMVLSGEKTASPHGTPSTKKISSGDMVLFDLGVIIDGYCSDITRTFAFQSITEKQQEIYDTVLQAQLASIEASKLGTAVGQVDLAAREVINEAGYGEYFTHRIGHGLGIETHEYPSMHQSNETKLEKGMCYTIEPGIYVPKIAGVRIEDMIFMTEKGPEVLTKYPKELTIIK